MSKRVLAFFKYSAIVAGLVLMIVPSTTMAQGRGRGLERGRNQSWKCGVFVNCHDARDGRVDGRGPNRTSRVWRNGMYVSRGDRVGYRNRLNTNDYWRRRHVTTLRNGDRWRYRNRSWRNQ
jgi:hypothetical protein